MVALTQSYQPRGMMIDYLTTPTSQTTVSVKAESDWRPDTPATRHLCAGVYLDRAFRNLVIRKVHNVPRRRAAPSYGFDLVPVVRHAWRSWWLDIGHLAAIAGSLAVSVSLAGSRTARGDPAPGQGARVPGSGRPRREFILQRTR